MESGERFGNMSSSMGADDSVCLSLANGGDAKVVSGDC